MSGSIPPPLPAGACAFGNIDILIAALGEPGTTAEDRAMFLRCILTSLSHLAAGVVERVDAVTKAAR